MRDNLGAVYDLLKSKQVAFTASGNDYLVKCLNPEHEDSDPSMRIDKVTGATHCFACGFKTSIFKYFGILTNPLSVKTARLKEKLANLRYDTEGLDMPEHAIPYSGVFRGISTSTMKEFRAFTTHIPEELDSRIVFPITDIRGKTKLFIARHTLSQANPRYIITPKNVKMPIFPAFLKEPSKSLVLVEGIFDLLNLYDKGMPNVACTFGTSTLIGTETKGKLLPYKAQGVTHIFILFDGDDAGTSGANKLKPLLEDIGFTVEVIQLAEGTDPGTLSQDEVDSIKEYTKGKSNN